ncbi:uncharacterized protein KGF55_000396 [Candida pseudojiufengensis]|uniref:uncharacterized protein n=1 Tax=Candida pseudojiufengensis TaxID=497109 RepID=UPI00222438E6|nr:uncharacterized protein KGF55_000396 [Candida pseudojiufengensis]KAI5966987.1 hypothetical protein KGF55_000396 [Candida pseudojiufengensis]
MLQKLPTEIIEKLGNLLYQDDIISLMLTNSYFYSILHSRLYTIINIDSTPKLFQHDSRSLNKFQYNYNNYKFGNKFIRAVNISSVYCLKAFFKQVNENGSKVKFLRFEKVPDLPDLELFEYLETSLPLMTQLEQFHWNHASIPLSFLKHNTQLKKLNGNITTDINLNLPLQDVTLTTFAETNASKLTLRNMDVQNFVFDEVIDLTLDTCTYKRNFMLDQQFPKLKHLKIKMDDDPCIAKLISKLNLETLILKSQIKVSLKDINKSIISLSMDTKLEFNEFKHLINFKNLKYLEITILEKDILQLLPYIPKNLKFIKFNILESIERNNCLIANEYWEFSSNIDQNQLKFQDFVLEYNRYYKNNYKWFMFNEKYVFECDENVNYRDGFDVYFDKIVNTLI